METGNQHMRIRTNPFKSTVLGIILILVGGLYFMHQAGMIDPRIWHVVFSWQMLLIALGILSLADGNYGWGTSLIVVGGLFMYKRYTGASIDYLWPLLIILAGIAIIFVRPKMCLKERFNHGTSDQDFINETAIFGGNDRIVHSGNFKGGVVVSIFGGSKIDLTTCTLEPDTRVVLEMTAIFGGSTFIVPPDWNVVTEVTSILGGFTDKRHNINADKSKTVIIRGVCIFGGGELM